MYLDIFMELYGAQHDKPIGLAKVIQDASPTHALHAFRYDNGTALVA